ncbi:MAG: CPBP family intramembrane metalloprotease [Ignavibacteriales bacterium]|nr:CPBP family intramembrane metalloprotease [Ignavibacteriales bacterium]
MIEEKEPANEPTRQPLEVLKFHPEEQSFVERHNINPILFSFICLFIIFVLYQIIGGTITFLVVGSKVTPENVSSHRILTLVGQSLFILVPTILFARLLSKQSSSVFPWRMPNVGETFFATLSLVFLQAIAQIYLFFQDHIPLPRELSKVIDPIKEQLEEMFRTLVVAKSMPELALVLLVVAIAPAIIEELLFRGLIQSSFGRVMTPLRAAVFTGIIFGAFHFNPFAVVPLVGLGVYFGFLRMRSKSIIISMTAHLVNNGIAVIVAYFKIDEDALFVAAGKGEQNVPALLSQLSLFILLFGLSFYSYLRATTDADKPHSGDLS